jgi:hypothetical protein
MGKQFDALQDNHLTFIAEQHMFFVGTAAETGKVNISPKGMDSLRVLGPNRILWLNLTGSGNETAGHIAQVNRITLMWCSFTTRPLILRAYGTARVVHVSDADWPALAAYFPAIPGARQIYDVAVDFVQSSCGYAVPFFNHQGPREVLSKWATDKGDALPAYWADRNTKTLDGFPTGIAGPT